MSALFYTGLMGLVCWWAWPGAPTFAGKVWTIVLTCFLAPFSWPWMIARGTRSRKAARLVEAQRQQTEAEALRQQNIDWWLNERERAYNAAEWASVTLADETLKAMGWIPPWARNRDHR